jgi:acetyl-CoA carboxylase biotin carboxyl carrier protein
MEHKEIESLIRMFEKSALAELKIRNGEFSIVLRKARPEPPAASRPVSQTVEKTTTPEKTPPTGADHASAASLEAIVSPIVGTFYRAPAPDAPPFVRIGSIIGKGKTLCIIEAMKAMNQFEAEYDCEIVRILVENGALVQFGTPMFEVRRV